jgi:hypothetical protein
MPPLHSAIASRVKATSRAATRRLRAAFSRSLSMDHGPDRQEIVAGTSFQVLERYVASLPSNQNALDIFAGEWSCQLPVPFADLNAGKIAVFEDPRVVWALSELGEMKGKTALELGPLEGAHTYMLELAGFASIIAIESNTRAYMKCLIVKEILGLSRARFQCGDFVEYLRSSPPRRDVVFASGVLYHMIDPAELIDLISRVTDHVFIWTHYYDRNIILGNPNIARKFGDVIPADRNGFKHELHRQEYGGETLAWGGFCGGSQPHSHWMSRADIMACLKHFGLGTIRIAFDAPDHPNGPSFALVASRS